MAFNRRTITKELDMANLAKHNDNYADIQTELNTNASAISTHVAAQSAHGSTSDATAGKIMQRDSNGRAKVAAPAASDDIARKAEVDAVQTKLTTHEDDAAVHLSADDRAKLDGVQDGAEPNQNAFSQVNDVVAATETDTLTIEGSTGITVSTNPTTKKVIITATGEATPGPHGPSHNIDGADPIPDLVTLRSDFDALTPADIGAETPAGAQEKVDALGEAVADQLDTKANIRWADVKDFGALGDGVQISDTYIQAAIDSAIKVTVYVPSGRYLLNNSLKLHSDTTLIVADDAVIELVSGCNKYFLENSDMISGNENIIVKGGRWVGNGATMTRNYGPTLEDSYYGFGFLFHKVNHLKVTDLRIDETATWAIAHMSCNYCEFRNIFVWQIEGQGLNGDGITGQSSNVVIDNIRGYTNDDMVAPLAYGAQMGANELHFEKIDTENISISNIFPMMRGTSQTWRAVAAYARGGKTIKNLNISNVFGDSYQSLIKISGHGTADGFFKNVNVSNINGRARSQGVIEVSNTTVYTLNVDQMCRVETEWNIGQIAVNGAGIVHHLNVSNINIRWENGTTGRVVYCQGTIYNLNLSNVMSIDPSNTLQKALFQNTGVVNTVNTKIKAVNIQVTEVGATDIIILQNSAKCSLDCMDFDESLSKFTPRKGDRVRDRANGPSYYNGTAWQNII